MAVTLKLTDGEDGRRRIRPEAVFRWTECVIAVRDDGRKQLFPMDDVTEITFDDGDIKTLGQVLTADEISSYSALDATDPGATGLWME